MIFKFVFFKNPFLLNEKVWGSNSVLLELDFSMNRNYFEDLQVVCYVLGHACMSNGYKLLVWFLLNTEHDF